MTCWSELLDWLAIMLDDGLASLLNDVLAIKLYDV
jgi:hypothetical protein